MDDKSPLLNSSKKTVGDMNIKVCIVCPVFHPGLGGIGRQAVSLTQKLHNRGLNLFVITRKLKGVPSFNSEITSVKLWAYRTSQYRIEAKTITNLLTSITFSVNLLINLIKKRKEYDLVHFHGASIPLLITTPFLKLLKKKIIAKVSSAKLGIEAGSFYGRYRFLSNVFISILKRVDAFVAISKEIEEGLFAEGYERSRIYRIPNFVDTSVFFPEDKKKQNDKVVIFSGALDKRKGIEILLEAWKDVQQVFPQWKLLILGDGLMKTSLIMQAETLGITKSTVFAGHVHNVPDHLRKADLFVLPSIQEGLPNSLLEAMGCELPVVASRIGGVVDVVEDGKTGMLFEPGNVADLSSALKRLVEDVALRRKLGAEARKTITEKFSIDIVTDNYFKIYQDLFSI